MSVFLTGLTEHPVTQRVGTLMRIKQREQIVRTSINSERISTLFSL